MSSRSLAAALVAALVSAVLVAGQRAGLGASLALLALLACVALDGGVGRRGWPVLALGAGLALQPLLIDVPPLVAVDVAGALVAASAAARGLPSWRAMLAPLAAPARLVAGSRVLVGAVAALGVPRAGARHGAAVLRGVVLALVLGGAFGGLFASGDGAFAELASAAVVPSFDPALAIWRAVLALAALALAGALARRPVGEPAPSGEAPAWLPGAVELRIALGAVVLVVGAFIAVQLRVLFGGEAYVRATTGLGYGDYARQGFVALIAASALTLALVAVAARRRDRIVRVLLGVLCALTLVVLLSAWHRLGLVRDAYGPTRVRDAGGALVLWFGAVFALVLAAGASARAAQLAPRAALLLCLATVLGYSMSNPDARIATQMVERYERSGQLDRNYAALLGSGAVPALDRLPFAERAATSDAIRYRQRSGDGLGGFNVARAAARR